ncbi:MAG TPA: class I SAM-dependent methyltransferase [Gemmatimonadales bacterium]|nr:class I SAM-dependent methyltransferase [Gemmatimonadales bacterium]
MSAASMPDHSEIRNVSDTAHWVAVYRAMETDRRDALFRDPYARRLAGARGEAIVKKMPRGRAMAWAMIVRTAVMDEIILRAVNRDGVRTVANLAAGLDTRPWRLDLPMKLTWLDVDLPDIQQYKRDALQGEKPQCQLEWLPADLADGAARQSVMARIAASPGPALVVTEGLLIYLEREQVMALATDLAATPSLRWWLIDIASPGLLKMMGRTWGKGVSQSAPFKFAPAEDTAFFEPAGWKEVEYRSMFEESLRLKRTMRLARFWKIVGRVMTVFNPRKREEFKRFSGIVLMERRR